MAAATMYVTVAGAGDKSGSTWANAMGLAEWETDVEGTAEAGDIYYVEEGTYTLTNTWTTALDGSGAEPIYVIGVKSGTTNEPPVFSDHAFTTARPLIACGANAFQFGDYWIIKGIRLTGTGSGLLTVEYGSVMYNIKSNNSSGTGGRTALQGGSTAVRVIGCESQSVNGTALYVSHYSPVFGCYIHDSADGISPLGAAIAIVNSVIDTCVNGINIAGRSSTFVYNSTIYNSSAIGIRGTTAINCLILNTIIDACAVGVDWTTASKSNYFDYNCWDNTDDVADSDIVQGDNKITGDPGMADPANGDFSIGTGSNCNDVAIDAGDHTGATV